MNSPSTTHPSLRRLVAVGLVGLIALVAVAIGSGRFAYVVTNGVSMKPTYHTGDLVVVGRASSYHTGEIVAYHAGQEVVLHRIIGGDATGFVIKGDNNQSIDATRPAADQLIGRAIVHIPKVGAALRPPISRGLLAVVVVALLGGLMLTPRPKPAAAHASLRRIRRGGTLRKGLAALGVLVLVALALTFVLAPHPDTRGETLTQTGALSYHAVVPVSDTYPTGEVSTGDPVFVKLLDTLGVDFHYATDAPPASVRGTARLDVALSTASGWHTTLPIVPPIPLVAGASDLTGTLGLARVQTLATRVGKATGLDAGILDVIVTASVGVSINGAKPVMYESRLPFQLTAFELSLSGPKASASPHGPAITSTSALNEAPPAAPDKSGDVLHQIRLGLLAALLLGVGTAVVVWPTGENDRAIGAAPRVHAIGLQLSDTPRIQLADQAALEDLAARLGCAIVENDDGWEAAVTFDALYWAFMPQPPPAEASTPAQAA